MRCISLNLEYSFLERRCLENFLPVSKCDTRSIVYVLIFAVILGSDPVRVDKVDTFALSREKPIAFPLFPDSKRRSREVYDHINPFVLEDIDRFYDIIVIPHILADNDPHFSSNSLYDHVQYAEVFSYTFQMLSFFKSKIFEGSEMPFIVKVSVLGHIRLYGKSIAIQCFIRDEDSISGNECRIVFSNTSVFVDFARISEDIPPDDSHRRVSGCLDDFLVHSLAFADECLVFAFIADHVSGDGELGRHMKIRAFALCYTDIANEVPGIDIGSSCDNIGLRKCNHIFCY